MIHPDQLEVLNKRMSTALENLERSSEYLVSLLEYPPKVVPATELFLAAVTAARNGREYLAWRAILHQLAAK